MQSVAKQEIIIKKKIVQSPIDWRCIVCWMNLGNNFFIFFHSELSKSHSKKNRFRVHLKTFVDSLKSIFNRKEKKQKKKIIKIRSAAREAHKNDFQWSNASLSISAKKIKKQQR